jgi:hypothetical protein
MSVLNLPRPEPQMRLVTVDPDLANNWLNDHNTHNRHLAPSRVGLYAQTMSKGLWRHPTGEPLIFDRLGRLQDGQHRLAAQVKAGQTITYWVMTDADPDDFLVIEKENARIPATPFGAVDYWVESQMCGSGQWADFAEGAIHGVGLSPGSPILALRRWGLSRSTMHGINQQLQVAIVSKAWNAFVDGREIQRITWSSSQLPMPMPKAPAA